MVTPAKNRIWATLACVVALSLAIMVPSIALAAASDPGGSAQTAASWPSLPWSQAATGTTVFIDTEDYRYWGKVPLTAGQTVQFTSNSASDNYSFMLGGPYWYDPPIVPLVSHTVGATTERLTFLVPATGDYVVGFYGSELGTLSIDAQTVAPPAYSLKSFSAPSSKRRNSKFTMSVSLSGDYDGFYSPIKFVIQHKVGKKWKKYATHTGAPTSTFYAQKFTKTTKIGKKGTYRVRAEFSDIVHAKKVTKWKTLKIKK